MKRTKRWLAGVCLVVAAIAAISFLRRPSPIERMFEGLESLGPWGPLALVAAYVVATLTFVPGIVLNLAAGALFGVFFGSLYALVGSTLGAILAFFVARALGGKQLAKWLGERTWALGPAVEREGFKLVVLSRLAPGLSFTLLNYGFGLTRVSVRDFAWGSVIGMAPYRIAYAYIGSVAGSFATLRGGTESMSDSKWLLLIAGLVVTVIILFWIGRIAKRAVQAYLPESRESVSLNS